jgi:hypothetical protein
MLGLALLSGGAHAAGPTSAAPAATEPFDPADLAGLVALDGEAAGESGSGDVHEGDPAGTCPGPSGCVADLILSTLAVGGSDRLAGVTTPGVAVIQNNSFSGLAADDVQLTITAPSTQRIKAEGCQQTSATTVVCPVGRVDIGARAAVPFVIESAAPTMFSWLVVTSVASAQPDPVSDNNARSATVDLAQDFERFARIAQINPRSCPVVEADVGVTDRAGTPFDGPVTGPGVLDVFDDGQWAGSPMAIDPNLQASSVVFLLDNSGGVSPARLQAHKALVAQAADDWRQQALAAGWPRPVFAAIGTAGSGAIDDFSADSAALTNQLAAIQPGAGSSRLYEALAGSTSALSVRRGRIAVVAFVEAGDGSGSLLADPLRSLQATGVPVYPIVSNPDLEPLARRIATASSGFRQLAAGDEPTALTKAMGTIRRQSRLSWVAPSGGEPRRDVAIRRVIQVAPTIEATGRYSQSETGCARPCIASRTLPAVGSFSSGDLGQVRLAIDPGDGPLSFSLRETLPAGVTVSSVSDGGFYNPADRSVRWDGKLISAPVEYTYRVYRSGVQYGGIDLAFKGTLNSGSALFPTCGDTDTQVLPRHPADVEANGRILPAVAQAYADAWRLGWPWVDGLSPIPIAHLTRAGQIQAAGPFYGRVDSPVPWTLSAAPPLPYVLQAWRSGPAFYTPGEDLAIALELQPHAAGVYGAVEEHVPGGWEVVSIGQAGVFDPAHKVIRWGPFQDNQPRTLDYALRAPANATQAVSLIGRYSVDGDQQEFSGRTSLGNALLDPLFADDFE